MADRDPFLATRMLVGPPTWCGLDGTCYECPFASAPLRRDGSVAAWDQVANDPTEAYFRCSLPGRDITAVVWGEHSPCTKAEWGAVAEAELLRAGRIEKEAEEAKGAFGWIAQEQRLNPSTSVESYAATYATRLHEALTPLSGGATS